MFNASCTLLYGEFLKTIYILGFPQILNIFEIKE